MSCLLARVVTPTLIHASLALSCLGVLLPTCVHGQSLPAELVVRTGQSLPDVAGATFTSIGVLPRLGAEGHVAFNSFITGGGVGSSNDFGYWVGTANQLAAAVREDTAGGGPDQFPSNANVGVDSGGTMSIWNQLSFPTPSNQNQWLRSYLPDGNGGNTIVAREGNTAAPGFAGGLFGAIGSGHAANASGAVAFTGNVLGGDATAASDLGLFTGTPGSLRLVAREGAAAPGATGTAPVFSTTTTTFFDKRINALGQVGFAAALSGTGVTAVNDRAIYVWTPSGGSGTLALAAQTGNVAPGTSATIKFSSFDDSPGFGDSGQVAFRSFLTSDVPGEITLVNNSGIWAGAPGSVQLIARSGDASPLAGLTFRTADPNPRINASGQVAFFSLVAGSGVTTSNDKVFWVTTPTGTTAVAREGSPAPGAGEGVNFNVLDPAAVINNVGEVAFTATLTGSGVSGINDRGLWAGLPGELSLIAREGDIMDLDPSEGELLKTISSISFANGYGSSAFESASAAFNDLGQIAWRAQFTDATTAVFLSKLRSTEPSADFDDDGDIDGRDFLIWQRGFGLTQQTDNSLGDADFDGTIDSEDLAIWQDQYGGAPPLATSTAVPEPACWTLLAVGLLTSFRVTGRRK